MSDQPRTYCKFRPIVFSRICTLSQLLMVLDVVSPSYVEVGTKEEKQLEQLLGDEIDLDAVTMEPV
jgi:hypothetical protein